MSNTPLVSVIITCYNQGRFLAEAIESVLAQDYTQKEIIVVDDGSTDQSSQIANEFPQIVLITQSNLGLAAARNTGLKASHGDYLVFLDGDELLLPHALDTGANRLNAHKDAAFAYGRYSLITADGQRFPATRRGSADGEPFLRLLRSNYIGMHATVMYRRTIFDEIGVFDTTLAACEDYDMYFRITRCHPIYCHGETVAEYRQHGSNMSLNFDLMLKCSISVLRSQRKYTRGNARAREAYAAGVASWQGYYGKKLLVTMWTRIRNRDWRHAVSGTLILMRYYPAGLVQKAGSVLLRMTSHRPRIFQTKVFR